MRNQRFFGFYFSCGSRQKQTWFTHWRSNKMEHVQVDVFIFFLCDNGKKLRCKNLIHLLTRTNGTFVLPSISFWSWKAHSMIELMRTLPAFGKSTTAFTISATQKCDRVALLRSKTCQRRTYQRSATLQRTFRFELSFSLGTTERT